MRLEKLAETCKRCKGLAEPGAGVGGVPGGASTHETCRPGEKDGDVGAGTCAGPGEKDGDVVQARALG